MAKRIHGKNPADPDRACAGSLTRRNAGAATRSCAPR
jgi:hypothetical protein